MADVKKIIGDAFESIATAIETGEFGKKPTVGLTTFSSEHGVSNLVNGAEMAVKSGDIDVVLIGPAYDTELPLHVVEDETAAHKKMEELLDAGEIDACVTMHYNFDIGVSTVGRVITPGKASEMFLATTTGTSDTERTNAMIKNAIYGIISAKAMGIKDPSIGILNVDNARTVERALRELNDNGYAINFGESGRADGGSVMRGNDLLLGSVDVMVSDTLTGNIMMKVFSSFTTGGSYEGLGYGYGPGIGPDQERTILILSRASGTPVVANAIRYAAGLAKGELYNVVKAEWAKAKAAGLDAILEKNKAKKPAAGEAQEEVKMPPKEVVTASVSGIDIMDLEDACTALWAKGIYAESGMGCTGPIVMVSEANEQAAIGILAEKGFVASAASPC